MIIRKSLVAAGVLAAAIGMTACSSNDSTDTATAPAKDVLQQQLTVFFDPAATVEQKEAVVERGTDRAALLKQFNGVLAGYPLTATVTSVTADGGTVTAVTDIATSHGTAPVPVTFTDVNGTWVITDASTCDIFGMGRLSCS
ncbi:nuclear transport factor 2 family protein [Prescottella subtropica]|uniref:nuclear transport factor 2 family protein n=1 Tax=Prescottella subtropica TaxID=2545757 RepID=UPI0010F533A7|nr:nuclear transport factor 2 family protein [Prescottella subtropica]